MVDKNEIYKKIREDVDYIRCPKCSNSITRFLSKNPEGVENAAIARLLMINESDVERIYGEAIRMLKVGMNDEN